MNYNRDWLNLSQQILNWTLVTDWLNFFKVQSFHQIDEKDDVHLQEFAIQALKVLLAWECHMKWNGKPAYVYIVRCLYLSILPDDDANILKN